ncbi:SDR family oxidoreductase [Actinomadura logoneensis]|uniref:SDR family oxidoreductase n=1 Tax=Actinomadura logoneensis TaxID=2293572 RepID=A0A372JDK4_9ACTN|nr:SDR family oxidoreductase [Actinomadura logoneensis]RFU38077.1 SDR family oxidoreductase [Actinomadura logoneensis]
MTESHVTLITGGGTGIGAATARELIAAGRKVAVTGRRQDRLDALAKDLGAPDDLLTIAGDAADYGQVEAAVRATVERFGRLDAVVANAGHAKGRSVADSDPDDMREMVLTNVLGPAYLIRAALPELTRSRGRIVIVGSVAGFVNTPGNLYGATKWAMTGLAENTRRLVTSDGVGVTLIAPGATESEFWDHVGTPDYPRMLTSEDIGRAIVWAVTQPAGVDVNTMVVRPVGQAN